MKSCLAKGCLPALVVLLLTACGGTGQASGSTAPNMLHVTRNALPDRHFASLDKVIHDAAQVQELYKAAYALKPVPAGARFNCPNDIGLEYQLNFLIGTTSVGQMKYDASGCQFLQINAQDTRFTTPSFQALLAKVLNLSSLLPPIIEPH